MIVKKRKRRTLNGQVELVIKDDLEDYLEDNYYWNNAAIISKANELKRLSSGKMDMIKNTYEFVRDEIKHSWDDALYMYLHDLPQSI